MITSQSRGHAIYFDKSKLQWLYVDTNEPINDKRPCKKCGQSPTKEGHDHCLPHVDGVISACCGHGIDKPFMLRSENAQNKNKAKFNS